VRGGGGFARVRGRTVLVRLNFDQNNQSFYGPGWNDNTGLVAVDVVYQMIFGPLGTIIARNYDGAGIVQDSVTVGTYAATTQYLTAIVLGGYDINGVPWHQGAVGTFDYGAAWYIRGGIYTNWTLLWRSKNQNITPLYPAVMIWSQSGTID